MEGRRRVEPQKEIDINILVEFGMMKENSEKSEGKRKQGKLTKTKGKKRKKKVLLSVRDTPFIPTPLVW